MIDSNICLNLSKMIYFCKDFYLFFDVGHSDDTVLKLILKCFPVTVILIKKAMKTSENHRFVHHKSFIKEVGRQNHLSYISKDVDQSFHFKHPKYIFFCLCQYLWVYRKDTSKKNISYQF